MQPLRLRAQLYRQFDADAARAVPAEAYGGWQTVDAEISPEHTALVVMHAWDCGAPHEFPGWRRAVEYMSRAEKILADIFPPLLTAVRQSPLPLFHVVGGERDYYSHLPGHRRALKLASSRSQNVSGKMAEPDITFQKLQQLRRDEGSPGAGNIADISTGFARLDFAPGAQPVGDEGIAENAGQLAALCHERGINHLIYVGFAINWCLLMSPGGMVDMRRLGFLCSTIPEAVTAVENRETAATEREKQQALWRVSVEFGLIFALADFLAALETTSPVSLRR